MADPMIAFRRLHIDGPGVGSNDPLWQAWLDLGYETNAPSNDVTLRNHSIRVLLQRASPRQVHIQGKADVFFQEPMLLAAAATAVNFRNKPAGAPFVKIGKAQFTPFPLADLHQTAAAVPASRYSELRVAPKSGWPPTAEGFTTTNGVFELAAPRLAATRGHIHVGCARDAEPNAGDATTLTRLLAIEWAVPGNYVRIFGGLFVPRRKTARPVPGHGAVSDAIAFDLTPEGIEFDAMVPDPFGAGTTDQIDITTMGLSLRFRLVVFDTGDRLTGMQLELIGQYVSSAPNAVAPFTYLNTKLASLSRNLAQQGCLLIQADTGNIPPLAWPLVVGSNAGSPVWTCENPQAIPAASLVPAVRLLENSVTARLLTRQDFGGGEPGVAEFSRHKTMLLARRPTAGFVLTIQSQAKNWTPGTLNPASPDLTLTWSKTVQPPAINPDLIKISAFSGLVEAAPLAARLGDVWAQSGAIATGSRPPYAFIALERGWVQMPLPPAPLPGDPPVSLVAADSAFRGYLRLVVDTGKTSSPADDPTVPGIEIVAAQNILVTVSWSKPDFDQPREIVAVVNGAAGTLDGALWEGEASPSPTEVLPPLDAGPAALSSVTISFGVNGPGNWKVTVAAFDQAGPATISFSLPLIGSATNPLLVWQPHPTLALVSSVSMTRTAESAMHPSATRELVPSEVMGSPAAPLILNFVASDGSKQRLPYVDVSKPPLPATAHGDGRWRWPWPQTTAMARDSYPSSPAEMAGVALASLTLPGIEFTAGAGATTFPVIDGQMCFSLRFDLPILDELFANAKAPETTPPAAPQPVSVPKTSNLPTALDMVALSGVWSENARRLARARTEADRVVLNERLDGNQQPVVDLWHPLAGLTGGVVRGIAEPYVWKPTTFSFSALPMKTKSIANSDINLGSYCLGADDAWQFGPDALGGLPDTTSFHISGNELQQVAATAPAGEIRVNGFASSSFPSADPAAPTVKHLQDARGLSLALAPDLTSRPQFTSRAAMLRAAPDDRSLTLATLRQPAKVKIGNSECSFWFRDLPLQQNPDTQTANASELIFDRSGGVETGFGPDPAAINRNRLTRTLYEWSFYGPPEPGISKPVPKPPRGRFEFDLAGPLAALPLRLLDVGFAADGHLQDLAILVSVQYRSPPSDGLDVAPFAAETIYATGNLVKMTFETDPASAVPGSLRLKTMERYELKDSSDPTAASDPFVPSNKPISLVSDMTVNHGPSGQAGWPTSQAQLTFEFKPGVTANAPDIAAANVRVRLFGQDCNLDAPDAGFTADGLRATFNAPAGQDGLLNLKKMQLIWSRNSDGTPARPQWYLGNGELGIPLRGEANSPIAVKRDFESGNLEWLALSFANAGADEVVDHDLGVITMNFETRIEVVSDPALFRGLFLPDGRLRGTVAVVFQKAYAVDGVKWPSWPNPKLGSAFAEFAFDAAASPAPGLPQRITAIRHRHMSAVDQNNKPTWRSRLLLDAAFAAPGLNTSSVSWPVGRVAIAIPAGSNPATRSFSDPASIQFNPDTSVPGDWKAKLQVNGTDDPRQPKLTLSHQVLPRLCAHAFPTDLLAVDSVSGEVILNSPWLFRAVADHTLQPVSGTWRVQSGQPAAGALTWTSVDELTLFDMKRLVETAKLAPDPARDRYAFLARYKDNGSDPDIRIAGVVRRALADAGFPVEYVMQALKTSEPTGSLVLTGAAVTEVVTSPAKPAQGVPLVLQWILPWAPMKNDPDGKVALGALASCPQTDGAIRTYDIALYDAAAGAPRPLDGAPVSSFAAQDGTQNLIEARMSAIVGGGRARTMVAVDQAILLPTDSSVAFLSRPLFPRTLLALSAVAKAFGALGNVPGAPFGSRISCVTARDDTPLTDSGMPSGSGMRLAEEVRFSVTAWPPDLPPTETPAPAVSIIVADDKAIHIMQLPAATAAPLVDPSNNTVVVEGQQRADAAMLALGLSASPRVVILASVDSSYLTIHDTGQPSQASAARPLLPHVSWLVANGAEPALAARRAHTLRQLFDTIYASPALGWPSMPRADELARAHADLGEEEVLRNNQAWAGRVRSAAWPAIAWDRSIVPQAEIVDGKTMEGGYSPSDAAEVRNSAFVAAGQRVALRRVAARNLRSAPDRLSVLAPPRARAPTVDAMAAAFGQARNPLPPDTASPSDRPGLAPMLPGSIEATVTGQRPGVLLTQFEGLLLTSSMVPFDSEFNRFGRPAWRAPLTVHQVRAPRSSELPEISDLTIRRKTYVAADEVDQGGHLKTFKVVRGPAQVVRFDRTADVRSQHAVTIAVQDPVDGRLSADWNGKIRLMVTVPNANLSAAVALARIGLLPSAGGVAESPRCELVVGDALVVFTKLSWGETDQNGHPVIDPLRLPIDLIVEGSQGAAIQAAVAQALNNSSADMPVRLTIRGTTPMKPGDSDPTPPATGNIGLDPAAVTELRPGPPHVLVFDLPHVPSRQRWLPVQTFTLAFGDPAYDRELGSPTTSSQYAILNVPHWLAVDRAEYDPSAKVHLAFWKQAKGTNNSPPPLPEAPTPANGWSLTVQIVPRDGSHARQLQIAATKPRAAAPNLASPRYLVDGCQPYAIALSSLREPPDPQNPAADVPVQFIAGDRLQITVSNDADPTQQLTLSVGIVAAPVLPPPASTYGLATLHRLPAAVGTTLFATAPLPQAIDFPDLLGDLVAGHVRRRGFFLWPFATNDAPDAGKEFSYLVKVDRTGGGQLPRRREDFRSYEH